MNLITANKSTVSGKSLALLWNRSPPAVGSPSIPPWEVYGEPTEFDYIVVVGGQTELIRFVSKQTYEFLRKAEELMIPLVGLCVGVFVLADAGILTNQ